jgi:hypothetical protein
MSTENEERNWGVWVMYRTGDYTQCQVGERFGVSAGRVPQITRQIDRYVRSVIGIGLSSGTRARSARKWLDELHLELCVDPSEGSTRNPWLRLPDTVFDLWTSKPAYVSPYNDPHYRIAKGPGPGIISMVKPYGWVEPDVSAPPAPPPEINAETKIADLPLSARVANCLRNDNYEKLGDLLKLTEGELHELLKAPNFGKKSLTELREFLYAVRGQPPQPPQPRSEFDEAKAEIKALKAKLTASEAEVAREYAFVNKLRAVLTKLVENVTVAELRKAGIYVDVRVNKD